MKTEYRYSQVFEVIVDNAIDGEYDKDMNPDPYVIYNELRKRGFNVDVGNLTVVKSGKDGKAVKKQ